MDDLQNQLRRLGQAAEADVDPIHSAQIVDPTSTLIDVEHESPSTPPQDSQRRTLPRRAVVGIAAALLVVLGSLALVDRSTTGETVGVTSADEDVDRAIPADDNGWAQLRSCESGSDYTIDTGNTFYGAYQFTWHSFRETATELGLTDYIGVIPSAAPPEVQDAVANSMYLKEGDEPWPICGRFLQGPMVTPVVPQWMSTARLGDGTIVFISPDVAEQRLQEISREITSITGDADRSPATFISKEEAFVEFQEMFAGSPDALDSVRVEDMPPRFELAGLLSWSSLQELRDIQGVFEVLDPRQTLGAGSGAPKHLEIPAIGLAEPVYASATTESLEAGLVVMGGTPNRTVIGGFGSVDNSVLQRLGELRNGDVVILSHLIMQDDAPYEVTERYVITLPSDTTVPATVPVDELQPRDASSVPEVVLVTDVAGDTTRRLILRAVPVNPDLSRYILPDDVS